MERTLPLILQWDENFDIGADTGAPVDDQDYQVPFRFNGKLLSTGVAGKLRNTIAHEGNRLVSDYIKPDGKSVRYTRGGERERLLRPAAR